jgi:type II secretory pathway predicted ATPase ExeA
MIDYKKFWNIERSAFTGNGQLGELFLTPLLKSQLDKVVALAAQPKSIVAVTGQPGAGKSAVASWLYRTLDYESYEVLLALPTLTSLETGWLVEKLCHLMCGAEAAVQPVKNQFRMVAKAMDQLIDEDRTLIVIIDQAERVLNSEVLDELLDLFAVQALAGNCLSFVLLGGDELISALDENSQLSSIVAARVGLQPLADSEVGSYVDFKLRSVEISPSPFPQDAIATIAKVAKGSPNTINRICENCLLECATANVRQVNDLIVMQACRSVLPSTTSSPGKEAVPRRGRLSPTKEEVVREELPMAHVTHTHTIHDDQTSSGVQNRTELKDAEIGRSAPDNADQSLGWVPPDEIIESDQVVPGNFSLESTAREARAEVQITEVRDQRHAPPGKDDQARDKVEKQKPVANISSLFRSSDRKSTPQTSKNSGK